MCKKYRMKKCLAGLTVFSMMMAFSACGKNEGPDLTKTVTVSVSEDSEVKNESVAEVKEELHKEENKVPAETETEVKEEDTALSQDDIYATVLDGYYADIVSEFTIDDFFPMTLGTFEMKIGGSGENALGNLGYALKDVNEDGTNELLIMKVSNPGETPVYGKNILAMYTIVNDEACFLTGGWERNRIFLLSDNRIFNEGSSGADDSSYDIYKLIDNTDILELLESKDSGSDDYFQKCEEMGKLVETVEIKLFSEYETSKDYPESAKKFWSAVYADPADKTYAITGSDSFTADSSEYAKDVVFYTPSEVTNFKFNSLSPVEISDGGMIFDEEELYSLERLIMDKAVTVTMEFKGDTPCYGISYTDAVGNVRRFAVCESGFDGSIVLSEYETR